MRFSVWSQAKGGYDYYEGGGPEATANVEKPGHLVSRTLGSTVEQAAWPLPAGSRLIGFGEHAIGRIAVHPATAARAGIAGTSRLGDLSYGKAGLLLVAAGLAYKFLVPKRVKARL